MRARQRWAAVTLTLFAVTGCSEVSEPGPVTETRNAEAETSSATSETEAVMREIFAGIRVALPVSVDRDSFRDPRNRTGITKSLDDLARNAALLEKHARSQDAQLQYLARSVSRDASEARETFALGRYDRSAFVLRQIVENCVVCHTRLPASEDSSITKGFVDSGVMESLPLEPRATLLTAIRRFDEALDALEALLADPLTHPAIMLGPLTDYLVISIRVKGDFERPVPVLEKFAQREDLWPSLRTDVEQWARSLPDLRDQAQSASSVGDARALIEQAEVGAEQTEDQSGLLRLIVASSILERVIATRSTRDAELGQAYYQLGMLEARIGRNYWLTRAAFLLDESIRIAPDQDFAREALAILERELYAAYEGSDVEKLPEQDKARLAELRALTQGHR
jgi:hypothetical protein